MNFRLRHNLLITTFIIVIIVTMWLLMKGLSYSFEQLNTDNTKVLTDNEELSKEAAYTEKIDHFALQEFDNNQVLSHFVEADNYYNFKDSPALLINPRVTTYDQQGEKNYILNSKRAHYLDSGEVSFKGQVDVSSSNGIRHKMNTQELLIDTNTDDLVSHKEVVYFGENSKMVSEGMHMQTKNDKMKLTGHTKIHQNSGQKILTKDLHVDQSDQQKHYHSNNDTTYLSKENKIYAKGIDMDMNKEVMQLLGKVEILQDSGSKINTKDLTVDQQDGIEVYRTNERIHYQSGAANIHAKGLHYDAIQQKIKLSGGVEGRYE